MKLLRYGPRGQEKPGLLDTQGKIRDLSGVVPDIAGDTLLPPSLDRLRRLKPEELPLAQDGARLGACVGRVGKFLCVGLNYSDHAAESNMAVPAEPIIFMKATSSISGPNDDVVIPRGSQKTDWEVELGVVIGAEAKYVAEADAMHARRRLLRGQRSLRARLPARRHRPVGEGQERRHVRTRSVRGWSRPTKWPTGRVSTCGSRSTAIAISTGSTKTMVFGVPFLVSYLSRFMSLQPGDVISTGTPPGVGLGQKPPVYLRAGNRMRLGIDGLGVQDQLVVG